MSFDTMLMNAIHGLSGWSGILDTAGIFLARYLPYLLAIPFIVVLLHRKTRKAKLHLVLFCALIALLSRGIITEAIRFFAPRERPFEAFDFTSLIPESGASFPSGHAAFFFAVSFAIFAVDRKWGWWFLGLSFLNGVARVFTGVHYPFDIVGGFLVALVSYFVVTRILNIIPLSEHKEEPIEEIEEEEHAREAV